MKRYSWPLSYEKQSEVAADELQVKLLELPQLIYFHLIALINFMHSAS